MRLARVQSQKLSEARTGTQIPIDRQVYRNQPVPNGEPLGFKSNRFGFGAIMVHIGTTIRFMKRQSISLTEPNDEWLKSQIDKKEYSSRSEIVNDLIRQARHQQRQIDWIRLKLEQAEESGFTSETKAQILQQSKDLLNE